jgi:hypothetical protein
MNAKSSLSIPIKKATIEQTKLALKQVPAKAKDEFVLKDAIAQMVKEITSVLQKGYSYDEVAEMLSQNQILIKGTTLKKYLGEFQTKVSSKKNKSEHHSETHSGELQNARETKPGIKTASETISKIDDLETSSETDSEISPAPQQHQNLSSSLPISPPQKPAEHSPQKSKFVDMPDKL